MLASFFAFATPVLRSLVVRTLIHVLRWVYTPLDDLLKRLGKSPGIPIPNPTSSYWAQPASPLAQRNSDPSVALPDEADIVIIGSGITGTSFAREILDRSAGNHVQGEPLRIVMLEARDACSGATARNGGHITPVLYQDYVGLKEKHGKDMAVKIIRFRLSHLTQLLAVAKEENLLDDSQCRQVDSFDVFHDKNLFRQAKSWLREYQEDLPEESANYKVYESPEQQCSFQNPLLAVSPHLLASVHPYRLVTGVLARLLNSYQTNFELFTNTPCTDIKASDSDLDHYVVETPRGCIRARHVVHATNGWASHLLPGMRGKIFPARGVMTAQVPREGLGCVSSASSQELKEPKQLPPARSWTGTRSFVFYPGSSVGVYDYLTQQLPSGSCASSSYPPPNGELMLGGGFSHAVVADVGNANDSQWNPTVSDYLRQALGTYFSVKRNGEKEEREEVKATLTDWTPSGEWIAAGYTGEGMVHAWMSGKALASMVLGQEGETEPWFPEVFRVTEERWRNASFEGFVGSYIG
ncbi:FAD dependent oxidoreductase-domain-containing protein [Ephemerocybe angulata]|uniref:FAD dependent oxidoreductase-domain-containing protein n=1 Tax=Ephemerocybe angulata TaxID=980116 RepID=A0A8H6IJ86_9AGAR|nr:FAD dependent oxidoreductase-domain-containing protein [Tulosesus angulatus]